MKEKPVIPSLREKRRYIAYSIMSEERQVSNNVKAAIEEASRQFLGEMDYSKAGLIVMANDNKGVARVNNRYLSKVRAAMTLITNINGKKVMIKVDRVSG